jgi:ECF transporter S component (folate family)
MNKNFELRNLILAGLFSGIAIICARILPVYFLPPGTFLVRLDLQFLVFALAGWIIGPGWAMGAAMTADVIGVLINPTGTGQFFPGYTLTAGLSGLLYGLILHKRSPSYLRAVIAAAGHMLLIALPLTSLWFSMQGFYEDFKLPFWAALPWRAALALPYSLLIYGTQKALDKAVNKL